MLLSVNLTHLPHAARTNIKRAQMIKRPDGTRIVSRLLKTLLLPQHETLFKCIGLVCQIEFACLSYVTTIFSVCVCVCVQFALWGFKVATLDA